MKKYKVCILKQEFYHKYPADIYPEILQKGENRHYLVLLLRVNGRLYAIPFRSNIKHKFCFKIRNNRGLQEGLDYTKALMLEEEDIDREAHLRPNTLPQIDQNINLIIRDFTDFLSLYKRIRSGEKAGVTESNILSMTTLKYFDI